MAQVISNAGHDDMIHDAVLDYYGRRLATCSSDKTIKIFEVDGDSHRLIETLKGHEGAVWCVSWAHPKFGTILASSSYDGRVNIWRETSQQGAQAKSTQWQLIYQFTQHKASVNLLSWAPHEAGCVLACASSDGFVSVIEFKDNNWDYQMIQAHGVGVNAVSWAPAAIPGAVSSASGQNGVVRRFVSGGSDSAIKIWEFNAETKQYVNIKTLDSNNDGHVDWVRDVAWSPSVLTKSYIASASQDKTVKIWTTTNVTTGEWQCQTLQFDAAAWRVSWSLTGNVLAVSTGDNKVTLWKERLSGGWENVQTIEE